MLNRLFIFLFILVVNPSFSQTDSSSIEKTDKNKLKIKLSNEAKTALSSAILPGLGQIKNKQIIKVPIIYAGLGTTLAIALYNQSQYIDLRDAYRIRIDGDSTTIDVYDINCGSGEVPLSNQRLLTFRDEYKRDRDFFLILTGLVYGLNIIDAYVFAHLKSFEIDDNLTLKPNINVNPIFASFHTSITIKYKF